MPSNKPDETVSILENGKINEKYYKLVFRSKALSRGALPGHFLHIQIDPHAAFLLRRPFSYYRLNSDRIEVLYEILGKGTFLLAQKKRGDCLKVMGPLGRSFTLRLKSRKRILVAGGVGVPPLIFLAERYPTDYVLIGCKSKAEVLPRKELSRIKAKVIYATDDGSHGKKGFVTVLLNEILKKEAPENSFVQTCGPKSMMSAVLKRAVQAGIPGEASLDEPMGCGVGACLGCMVKTPRGWVASCMEGPVFSFDDLAAVKDGSL